VPLTRLGRCWDRVAPADGVGHDPGWDLEHQDGRHGFA